MGQIAETALETGSTTVGPSVQDWSGDLSDRTKVAVRRLLKSVSENDIDQIRSLFDEIAESPIELELCYDHIQARFTAVNQGDLFLDLILAARAKTFSRLRLVTSAIATAQSLGREDDVLKVVSEIRKSASPAVRWGPADQLNRAKHLGKQGFREIRALKYEGVPLSPERLFECADALADRIDLPQGLLDHLYACSRHRSMPRAEWERHVRAAFAADHITKDFVGVTLDRSARWIAAMGVVSGHVDEALKGIDRSKGILVVLFHGGLLRISLVLLQHVFKGEIVVMAGGVGRQRAVKRGLLSEADGANGKFVAVSGNERSSLFRALRVLQDGKVLSLTPDAPFGNITDSIVVHGITVPVASGAPFLAYETKCNTVWLTFVREGQRLAPQIAIGPRRETNEKYGDFKGRWYDFYKQRIEDFLSGDPSNLAFRPHWVGWIGRAGHSGAGKPTPL